MIYELRIYEAMPGKLTALGQRFANHTCRLLETHGMSIIGIWEDAVGISNRITYILAFSNLEDRDRQWASFYADSKWHAVVAETEKDGPLVKNIESSILSPTHYSPLQ